jgi:sarcosine oxidase, subunit delta
MLLIYCPYCEMERPETEFRYGGQAHLTRPAASAGEAEWTAFLFLRTNGKGPHAERWRHATGCGKFFNCIRDTVSDKISVTYKAGQTLPAS